MLDQEPDESNKKGASFPEKQPDPFSPSDKKTDSISLNGLHTQSSELNNSFVFETERAERLFTRMQRLFEERDVPIVKFNQDDFYVVDKGILEATLSDGATFLWLIHPNGTHLGRIGVIEPGMTVMKRVLDWYRSQHPIPQLELYKISISPGFDAEIEKIDIDTGILLASEKPDDSKYDFSDSTLFKNNAPLFKIKSAIYREVAVLVGNNSIQSVDSEYMPTREDIIVACLHGESAIHQLTRSFCKASPARINGAELFSVFSPLVIPEPTPGKYGDGYVAIEIFSPPTVLSKEIFNQPSPKDRMKNQFGNSF